MLLAVDLDEDFIDVERIAIASVFSLKPTSINRSEFDTPESDGLSTDGDAALGEKIFNISVTEIEPVVEPVCVGNDIRWESVMM